MCHSYIEQCIGCRTELKSGWTHCWKRTWEPGRPRFCAGARGPARNDDGVMIRQKGFCNKCEYSNKLEEVKRHLEKNEMKRRNKREHEEKGGIFGLGNKTWTDEEIEEEKHAREAYEQAQERICQIKAVRTQMDQDYLEAELKADEELVNRVREQYDKFMESLRQVRAVRARRDQDNLDATPKAQENS